MGNHMLGCGVLLGLLLLLPFGAETGASYYYGTAATSFLPPQPQRPFFYRQQYTSSGPFSFGYHSPHAPAAHYSPRYSPYTAAAAASGRLARVDLIAASDSGVSGSLYLREDASGQGVIITGEIYGLSEGLHGFHVHAEGQVTDECRDAAGHFNPFELSHGDPTSLERHVGDLGNIYTFSSSHPTRVLILDRLITLSDDADADISRRAVVVHAGEDDLGRGGDDESGRTGNAGARVACGVITPVNY